MKQPITLLIAIVFISGLSSCYIDLEFGEPYVDTYNVQEYETSEVISSTYVNGHLVSEEVKYQAWLEMQFQNVGDFRARNVFAEITFYNYSGSTHTTVLHIGNLSPGESVRTDYYTGYEFISDFADYNIEVFWD